VTGCGFEALEGAVQPFLVRRGEGLKLDPDPVRAGPADYGALDQDRRCFFSDVEQEIHLHSGEGSKGTFEPTSFAREIPRFANRIKMILVDEGAGKRRWKPGILSHHHRSALFFGLAAWAVGTLNGGIMQM
jgi:hypothetical protein